MAQREYGLGRLHAPDERDRGYALNGMMMQQLRRAMKPKARVYAYRLGPTLDQGLDPHCVGYSCRHRLTAAPIMVKADEGVDPVTIYHDAQKIDEWPGENYDGTSVRAGFQVLRSKGHFKSFVWATSVEQCEQFIRGGFGTIVLGTVWKSDMFEVDSEGFIHATGTDEGGHAYHLFWMRPNATTRSSTLRMRPEAWIQNSWGEEWGTTVVRYRGCAKVSYDDLGKLLADNGEAGAPVEVKLKAVV